MGAKVTVLIRCTIWCDWFPVSKRTNSWPNVRQIEFTVWSFFFGVLFGKYTCIEIPQIGALKTHKTGHRIKTVEVLGNISY